jgi:flagellar M-ring protein FliF
MDLEVPGSHVKALTSAATLIKDLSFSKVSFEKRRNARKVAKDRAVMTEEQKTEDKKRRGLEEVKARMASMKPKKQSISADLLNTANSYDDKVALIRMIMAEDSTRVAGVLKSLIEK